MAANPFAPRPAANPFAPAPAAANPFAAAAPAAANPFAPKPAAANPFAAAAPAANPFAAPAAANPFAAAAPAANPFAAPAANPFAPKPAAANPFAAAAPAANPFAPAAPAAAAAAAAPLEKPFYDADDEKVALLLAELEKSRAHFGAEPRLLERLQRVLYAYRKKGNLDSYAFRRFVYTFAKDVRASDMPPLMTPQEWNRELDERVRDTSFDPPVLSRPEVVDGFAGLVAHVARRQGEVADAGKRARDVEAQAKVLQQILCQYAGWTEQLRSQQEALRATMLRVASKIEAASAGHLPDRPAEAVARRCVLGLRQYLTQESQLRERVDQLLLIQRMRADAAAHGGGGRIGGGGGEEELGWEDKRMITQQLSLHAKGIEQALTILRRDEADLGIVEERLLAVKRSEEAKLGRQYGFDAALGGRGTELS